MPVYEFKCQKCGNKYELRLGFFHKKEAEKCPQCGNNSPERIYSGFSTGLQGGSACSSNRFG